MFSRHTNSKAQQRPTKQGKDLPMFTQSGSPNHAGLQKDPVTFCKSGSCSTSAGGCSCSCGAWKCTLFTPSSKQAKQQCHWLFWLKGVPETFPLQGKEQGMRMLHMNKLLQCCWGRRSLSHKDLKDANSTESSSPAGLKETQEFTLVKICGRNWS